jgi:hypothetical protein
MRLLRHSSAFVVTAYRFRFSQSKSALRGLGLVHVFFFLLCQIEPNQLVRPFVRPFAKPQRLEGHHISNSAFGWPESIIILLVKIEYVAAEKRRDRRNTRSPGGCQSSP